MAFNFGGGISNLMGQHPNRGFNQAQAEPRPYGISTQPQPLGNGQLGAPPMGQPMVSPGMGNMGGSNLYSNAMPPANPGVSGYAPSPSPYTNGGNQMGGPMQMPAATEPSPYGNGGNQVPFGGQRNQNRGRSFGASFGGGYGGGTALGDLMGGGRRSAFTWGGASQDR